MQDENVKKLPILIASGLKPVRDSRAYEKLGLSLRETNKYNLNFIGFSAKTTFKQDGIRFFSSISHTKSLWERLKMPFRWAIILLKIRPKILICCSWELLPFAKLAKPWLGYRLLYDIQENYQQNLNLNPELGKWKKKLRSKLIHWAEKPKGIDHFLLAEACYAIEMPEKTPYLILENRFSGPDNHAINELQLEGKRAFHFVLGGTITPVFGSLDAIHWFKEISIAYPESTLTIVGHVPLSSHLMEVKKITAGIQSIHLLISEEPLDHSKILNAYRKADFILMPYQNRPEIKSKMPTKLFESAALGVPLLFSPNPKWEKFIQNYQGGYPVDFTQPEIAVSTFQHALSNPYFTHTPPVEIYWISQKAEFLALIDSL